MNEYGRVIVVGAIAVLVRFMILPDSVSTTSKMEKIPSVLEFLIRNRLWLYMGLMVYLIFFARKNTSKQLMASWKYDVGTVLRSTMFMLGLAIIFALTIFIYSYLK